MALFFLDTEFLERGNGYPIEPISIALVSEFDREFYAVNEEWYRPGAFNKANKWVVENVLEKLPPKDSEFVMPLHDIGVKLTRFIGVTTPAFWGWYSAYDWVVVCQLYGGLIHLPISWPRYCHDMKQLSMMVGNPDLPKLAGKRSHVAIDDAKEIKYRFEWVLNKYHLQVSLNGGFTHSKSYSYMF